MIIFVEDSAQKNKIIAHLKPKAAIIVFYNKRWPRKIELHVDGNKKSLFIFWNILSSKTIICEFANLLPRAVAFITSWKIESHIFGYLTCNDLDKVYKLKRRTAIQKLITPLCADFYCIYGDKNPTLSQIKKLREHGIPCETRARVDLSRIEKINETTPWAVYIGQPFAEHHLLEAEFASNEILNYCRTFISIVYVRHPRQVITRVFPADVLVIDGYSELIRYISANEGPALAISVSSSLSYELAEMGVLSETFQHVASEPKAIVQAKQRIKELLQNII